MISFTYMYMYMYVYSDSTRVFYIENTKSFTKEQ